jgi:hypothetical protein
MQGLTTAGRPHSRTAQSALRSIFMEVADFRLQRELTRAKPRLRGSGGGAHESAVAATGPGRQAPGSIARQVSCGYVATLTDPCGASCPTR